MSDQTPDPNVPAYTVSATAFIPSNAVGDYVLGAFVCCRGCGAAVAAFHQPSLRTHLDTCVPLRSLR